MSEYLIPPKTDITFHYSGLIEISAKLASELGLRNGDFVNFEAGGTIVKKHPYGIQVRCRRGKKNDSGFLRASSVKVARLYTSTDMPVAKFRIGEVRNQEAYIITRINYAAERN